MSDLPLPARAAPGAFALLLSCAPAFAVPGQDAPSIPAPRADDAAASVPSTRYRTPIDYQAAERPATTPDRHWLEANRIVQGYQPMMLTMPRRPAAPATSPDALTKPDAPAHHHQEHH